MKCLFLSADTKRHFSTCKSPPSAFGVLFFWPQVKEAELPLIAILGPTGAKVFSFTGCLPAPDLATALAEFVDANDLASSDAVKPKVGEALRPRLELHPDDLTRGGGERNVV